MKKIIYILRKEFKDMIQDTNVEFAQEICIDSIVGLKTIKEESPQVVVIDLGLNKVSGLEMIEIMRSNPLMHHTKIVATAKSYNDRLARRAYELGADYFVKYPIDKNVIKKIMELGIVEKELYELN